MKNASDGHPMKNASDGHPMKNASVAAWDEAAAQLHVFHRERRCL